MRAGALLITLGDPAGIGPEIVQAALASGRLPETAEYSVIGRRVACSLGQPTAETAHAALDALEESAALALRGEIQAVVTGPIHKARMYEIGFQFPGQTEFFANRAGVKNCGRTRLFASACFWKIFFVVVE